MSYVWELRLLYKERDIDLQRHKYIDPILCPYILSYIVLFMIDLNWIGENLFSWMSDFFSVRIVFVIEFEKN